MSVASIEKLRLLRRRGADHPIESKGATSTGYSS
jgi:hypothetical protein